MINEPASILLIGFGPHAKRIYYPIYRRDGDKYNFKIACAVDLERKRQDIEFYLRQNSDFTTPVYFIPSEDLIPGELSLQVRKRLDEIVRTYQIKGIILATEPLAHTEYAQWALEKGLSILLDKPISTHEDISTSQNVTEKLIDDYNKLLELYKKSTAMYGRVLFSVMTQRRYHSAFCKAKTLIRQVFEKTNCPITSIQSFHADGQWRLPDEIIEQHYHPYNQGYGKCSHSGYHFFDIVPWLLEAAESQEKSFNNVDVFSNFLRPKDFFSQLRSADYENVFKNYSDHKRYSDDELNRICESYGEIDAFNSFVFKHGDRTMTLGSINLVHNGFSQRGWLSTEGRNLYKGNGRLRHETHFIEQGPFQAISIISYQSEEVRPDQMSNLYNVGGEYHFDIHVFRNSSLFTEWKAYETYSISDLQTNMMAGKSRGHQEDAKRRAVLEFVRYLNGENVSPVSDLTTHWRSVQLMYGVYKSAANRFSGVNPLVNVSF